MNPKQALVDPDRRLGGDSPDLCDLPGLGQRRGVSLPVRGPPGSELFRPSADDGLGRDGGPGLARCGDLGLGRRGSASSLLFAGSTVILARLTGRYYGAEGRIPGGVRPESDGLLRAGGLDVRPARRSPALLLAADDRPARASRSTRPDPGSCGPGSGRPRLGRGHAEQVSRRLHSRGRRALRACSTPGCGVDGYSGPARTGARDRADRLQPGPDLECRHGWVSFLFQGGRAVGGWMPRPDYLAVAILAQAGYLFPWIWVPLVVVLVRGWRGWSDDRHGSRAALALPGGRAARPSSPWWPVSGPVLPHWGLIGLVSLFPMLGRNWAERLGNATRGRSPSAGCLRRAFP